jgi:hypothetical protein
MSEGESKNPQRNTPQWKKNEKIINENPVLKQARDTAEGIAKPAHKYRSTSGNWHGGKGSRPRVDTSSDEYKDNFDRIFKQGKYAKDD